jgi:hypothetical protein
MRYFFNNKNKTNLKDLKKVITNEVEEKYITKEIIENIRSMEYQQYYDKLYEKVKRKNEYEESFEGILRRYNKLELDFIDFFINEGDIYSGKHFTYICQYNRNITEDFILKHINKLDYNCIEMLCKRSDIFTLDFLKKVERIRGIGLCYFSICKYYPLTEDFIENNDENIPYICWNNIIKKSQYISKDYIKGRMIVFDNEMLEDLLEYRDDFQKHPSGYIY